ncbi:MAG: hypothetical protein HY241_15030 [Actinobacteria bacterium]|nr:hypothetical protein [Actinomycetota bacterium]
MAATARRSLAVSANIGAAFAAATGGTAFVGYANREAYVVLTDRQLILFEANPSTGSPGKHLTSIPRSAVAVHTIKDGRFLVKVQLAIRGSNEILQLTFAPLPPSARVRGRALAALEGSTPPRTTQPAPPPRLAPQSRPAPQPWLAQRPGDPYQRPGDYYRGP